nr:hypothetical protein CFP56_31505 [Quercus suber]
MEAWASGNYDQPLSGEGSALIMPWSLTCAHESVRDVKGAARQARIGAPRVERIRPHVFRYRRRMRQQAECRG